jgi:serine kinase of HPr protein (carbohydrate metabolism regulator)
MSGARDVSRDASAAGFVHATAVVIGEHGVLIRGASGAGKSTLASALIAEAAASGRFARLVGDDRVSVSAAGGAPVARPHPAIAGAIEQRGEGILAAPYEPAATLAAVVDLCSAKTERFPEDNDQFAQVAGHRLPRLALQEGSFGPESVRQVLFFLDRRVG